jgi:hypothetical protein
MIEVKCFPMTAEGFKECAENCDFLDGDVSEVLEQAEFATLQKYSKEFITPYGQVIAVCAIMETNELCFLANTTALRSHLKAFIKVARKELSDQKTPPIALIKQGSSHRRKFAEVLGFKYVGMSEKIGFEHYDFMGVE